MKEILKKSLKVIVPIIFLVIGIFLGQDLANISKLVNTNQPSEVSVTQEIQVDLMIDYGQDSIVVYNHELLRSDQTVFDLLKQVTSNNNLKFVFSDKYKDLGILVESIDGVENSTQTNRYWHYWVNNRFAQNAVDKHNLKDGDIILFKYIKSQY
ncbi:DUF4430 domain-containing protein [Patescibacteria group bacterium]|nr:DUF4430 domain-containing protein [Patescibacteria group bacterium]